MKQDIKKLLGLQSIWIDSWIIQEKEIIVRCRSPRTSCMCPSCTNNVKRVHQYSIRKIKHSIWQDRIVILHLRVRRFYCNKCKQAFGEDILGIDKRRTTANFRNILIKDMKTNSLSYVQKMDNVSSTVLYSVLKENYGRFKDIDWKKQGKKFVLGIDEHSYRGRNLVLTATNITKQKLLMVGTDDRLKTLRGFLRKADKKRICEVCIDMKRGYLNVIKEELPGIKITVDKFHVVAYANRNMDEIRSIVVEKGVHIRRMLFKGKEKLNEKEKIKLVELFSKYKSYPSLYEAYFIKEKLRDLYKLKNRRQAKKQFDYLVLACEHSQSRNMKIFGKTLLRWQEEILNYFNNYSTNAFTEGVHTKIKMIKRVSFGFRNINNYIAKVTLAFIPLLCLIQHTIC